MKKTSILAFFLSLTFSAFSQIQDTVFWLNGDTTVGKINLKKENNRFSITDVDLKTRPIEVSLLNYFICFDKESDYERKEFYNLLGAIYQLELGKNSPIKVYSRSVFKEVKQPNSEPFFETKKEFCFFKKGIPYPFVRNNFKSMMLSLLEECEEVHEKFRKNKYKADDCIKAIMEYNSCGLVNR